MSMTIQLSVNNTITTIASGSSTTVNIDDVAFLIANLSTINNGGSGYQWVINNTTVGTKKTMEINTAIATTYNFTLTTYNLNNNAATQSLSFVIIVGTPAPVSNPIALTMSANINGSTIQISSGSAPNVHVGDNVQLTVNATGGANSGYIYHWTLGTTILSTQTITVNTTVVSTYTYVAIVLDQNITSQPFTVTINVQSAVVTPQLSISATINSAAPIICQSSLVVNVGDSLILTAGGSTNYNWILNATNVGTLAAVTVTTSIAGSYIYTVVAVNATNATQYQICSIVVYVVSAAPIVLATAPASNIACSGSLVIGINDTLTLTTNEIGAKYLWVQII